MSFRRWINALVSFLFGRSVRGQKPPPPRHRSRLGIERLEERLPPAAGLTSANQQLVSAYGQLPLSFEANQGQTAAQVQYLTQGSGYSLFLTSSGAVLSLTQPSADPSNGKIGISPPQNTNTTGVTLALNLVGANPNAAVTGLDQLPGTSNYFIGNDPSQWHTSIPNYSKVEYQNVYPGINLVYYGNQQQLEYDYQLAPGANPSSIRFAVQGADSVTLDSQGNLVLHTALGDVLENAPVIYQQVAGTQKDVSGQFVLLGNNEVGFQVGAYDATLPLVIDPVLSYSTYLGGIGNTFGFGIAVDGSGNAYVAGYIDSSNFPTTTGAYQTSDGSEDAFVSKLNASGTALVYSTYLGGNDSDYAYGIAVDGSGNAYITGTTSATNFPTTTGAFQTSFGSGLNDNNEAFVTELNGEGTALVYSTFLRSNNGDGSNFANGIAVDNSGNAYVTGMTESTDFPTTTGAFQSTLSAVNGSAFVCKFNPTGTALVYSTFLDGPSGGSKGTGIALDAAGHAYVIGVTGASDFPITGGAFQTTNSGGAIFVSELNTAGTSLVYSTFLGTGTGNGIAVDAAGHAFVTGYTNASDFPTTVGAFQTTIPETVSAFVSELNSTGTGLLYSTFLGGSGGESSGQSISLDSSDDAYVTGYTPSANFPTTTGAFQTSIGGGDDAFVTKLNPSGTGLIYSTYLGGSNGYDSYGYGIAVDNSGNAYVTGYTDSSNFPTTSGAFQPDISGPYEDVFVAKLDIATPTVTSITPTAGATPGGTVVTITGTSFTNATAVMFGSTAATTFTINSDTQITATAPAGADGVVDVTVVAPGGTSATSAADQFTFSSSITVTSKTVNGDFLNVTSSIISAVETVHSVQIITAAPDGYYLGELVQITGVGVNGFNGTYAVGSVIDATEFTYTAAVAGLGISNGGTSANALGGSQRSMVDSITYQFNQAVTLGAGAISMDVNSGYTGVAGALPGTISYATIDDGHTWVVTFSGANVIGNSIADGVYDITLNASAVTADVGDGTLAASQTDTFFRLFGDSNGDASVTSRPDVQDFASAFGTSNTSSAYVAYFDYDADGSITSRPDVENFASRFGTSLSGFTATI